MKVSNLTLISTSLVVLATLPTQSKALKCGIKGVTKPCIGQTDSRYNQDVTYNLKEQNNFWKSLEGLYVQDVTLYESNGTAVTNNVFFPAQQGTYDFSKAKSFVNITVDGSRLYNHRYLMVKHNSDGPGGKQFPGFVNPTDQYAASTFEKNGEAKSMGVAQGFGKDFVLAGENPATFTPIGEKVFLIVTPATKHPTIPGGSIQMYDSTYCLDSDCKESNIYNEAYIGFQDEEGTPLVRYMRTSSTKVDTDTWMAEIDKVYTEFAIPSPKDPSIIEGFNRPPFTQPFNAITSDKAPACAALVCPTNEDWALVDPYLGTSPYIEPEGILTGGFIAGVTIASIVVAMLIFYMIYTRGVEAREKRVKEAVLKSLSKTMSLKISKNFTAQDLNQMFQKIDTDGNGSLDKGEMKGLVEGAGVVNMSDRDYDLLFASIDLDENGTLDFVEFCAFFASIKVEEGAHDNFED